MNRFTQVMAQAQHEKDLLANEHIRIREERLHELKVLCGEADDAMDLRKNRGLRLKVPRKPAESHAAWLARAKEVNQ